jgi:hypothetical protein
MRILADVNSGTYKLVLVLHILAAIIGFGGVFLNSLYGQQAKARRGREGLAIAQANYLVSNVAEFVIYTVFVFGVLLVILSDDAWTFGQFSIWSSMALFIIGIGVAHAVLRPNVRRMNTLMAELAEMGSPPMGTRLVDRRGRSPSWRSGDSASASPAPRSTCSSC